MSVKITVDRTDFGDFYELFSTETQKECKARVT